MKRLAFVRLLAGLWLVGVAGAARAQAPAACPTPDPNFHIYLLMGQSNMAGRGPITPELAALGSPQVFMLNAAGEWVPAHNPVHFDKPQAVGVGPGLSFGSAMAAANPTVKIGLVPCAVGGTSSANPKIRLFELARATSLTPQDDCKGEWQLATPATVREFSAIAYQYGRYLQQQLGVPVGLIVSAVGGTRIESWMSTPSLRAFPEVAVPASLDTVKAPHKAATTLFNGMIAPLLGYGSRGFIWYQGESNRHEPALYGRLFPVMVADWRRQWGAGELPFYYVQIAPYGSQDKGRSGPLLREA